MHYFSLKELEMFYLNSTLNFVILSVLVFQLEVYYRVDRLLTGLTAQQKGTTAQWYINKTSLVVSLNTPVIKIQKFIFDPLSLWVKHI